MQLKGFNEIHLETKLILDIFRLSLMPLVGDAETGFWQASTWVGQMWLSWWGKQLCMCGRLLWLTLLALCEKFCLHSSVCCLAVWPVPAMTKDRYWSLSSLIQSRRGMFYVFCGVLFEVLSLIYVPWHFRRIHWVFTFWCWNCFSHWTWEWLWPRCRLYLYMLLCRTRVVMVNEEGLNYVTYFFIFSRGITTYWRVL